MTVSYDALVANPRMQAGIVEIQRLIRAKYPGATFEIQESPEPEGVYMRAIVDVDEPFLVMDSFIDRLAEIQADDELPLSVVVMRTPERMKAAFQRIAAEQRDAGQQSRHADWCSYSGSRRCAPGPLVNGVVGVAVASGSRWNSTKGE